MADNVRSIFLFTVVGGVVTPTTTGNYDLRATPFTAAGIAGSHLGNGIWNFTTLNDTLGYKLYDTTGGTEVTSFTGGGTNTRSFYDTSLQTYLPLAGGTMTGSIAMGTNKLTNLGAGTTNGDSVRYEQAGKYAVAGEWSAVQTFGTTSAAALAKVNYVGGELPPLSDERQYAYKGYVDAQVAGSNILQSDYTVKFLKTESDVTGKSYNTLEKCVTYLNTLASIASFRGLIICEPAGVTVNRVDVDDGASAWIGNGIDIHCLGRMKINRQAPNNSLTYDGTIINGHILDNAVVATRTYASFTFFNCDFYGSATNLTFSSCKFRGINRISIGAGKTLTLTDCTGAIVMYNDDATLTFSGTQPAQLLGVATANLGVSS